MTLYIIFCLTFNIIAVYSTNNTVDDRHNVGIAEENGKIDTINDRHKVNITTENGKIDAQNEECTREHKIDLKMMFGEMKTNKNFEATRAMHCFAACLLKKNGLMNSDGSLTRKYNDSAGAQECKNITGRDECDAAFKIMNCLNKHEFLMNTDN